MKIGILETGDLDPALAAIDGSYPDMFIALSRRRRPEIETAVWTVFEDAFPQGPDDADLWLVTGSRFGVYEDAPWMRRLSAFLQEAHAGDAPILGVCFGHQILAHALGGAVVKSERGWGLGVRSYDVVGDAPPVGAPGETIALHTIHQDQVVAEPEAGRIWLASEFCPIAGLAYGPEATPTALTVQPHPEFSARLLTALISARAGVKIPQELADAALEGVAPDPEGGAILGEPLFAAMVDRLAPIAEERARRRRASAA